MTLASKQKIWRGALAFGFVVFVISAAGTVSPLILTAIAASFLIVGILQFRWFRCPYCNQFAVPPSGLMILSVLTQREPHDGPHSPPGVAGVSSGEPSAALRNAAKRHEYDGHGHT